MEYLEEIPENISQADTIPVESTEGFTELMEMNLYSDNENENKNTGVENQSQNEVNFTQIDKWIRGAPQAPSAYMTERRGYLLAVHAHAEANLYWDVAEEAMAKAIGLFRSEGKKFTPTDLSQYYFRLAIAQYHQGKFEEVVNTLDSNLDIFSNEELTVMNYHLRTLTFFNLNAVDAAIEESDRLFSTLAILPANEVMLEVQLARYIRAILCAINGNELDAGFFKAAIPQGFTTNCPLVSPDMKQFFDTIPDHWTAMARPFADTLQQSNKLQQADSPQDSLQQADSPQEQTE